MNTEEFINKAKKIHGDKYDYSKVEYINSRTKVCVICSIHGEFWQTPNKHLQGQECPFCATLKRNKKKSLDISKFINKAKEVHGDKYDYSKVEYINNKTKVCIICPIHGEFWQRPDAHLKGKGCALCSGNVLTTTEEFINKAKEVHGDKYDYSKVEYINNHTKVCIICPIHGEFWQTPKDHLKGQNCPICQGITKLTTEDFIEKSKKIHGDKYDYSKVKYVNNTTKVCIICPVHGEFWQRPNSHLRNQGCPSCGGNMQLSTQDFIEKSKKIHGDKYDYSKVDYTNNKSKVCIICPKHGEFWQRPNDHLTGYGCPNCNHTISKSEIEISDFLNNLLPKSNLVQHDHTVLDGLEIDLLIPSLKLGIEYNGLYWHSEAQGKGKNYHLNKTLLAESKGYHLIQIFEDEWLEHKDIVLSKLKHIIACDNDKVRIGGRKCIIREINKQQASVFLEKYHIQGFVGATIHLGAFYGNTLLAVMSFKEESISKWNLVRFASDFDYVIPGLANKLLSYFKRNYKYEEIKTFLDRRWSHSSVNVYDRMGFTLEEVLSPEYRYVVGQERKHKFGFRKQILAKKYNLPLSMTEYEMTQSLGISRIWDCGLLKYVIKNNEENPI